MLKSLDENSLSIPAEQPSERGLMMREVELSCLVREDQRELILGDWASSWEVMDILGREKREGSKSESMARPV